jgi:uncharacterized protein (TIRG00374 family)
LKPDQSDNITNSAQENIKSQLHPGKIIIPILIGLAVVALLIFREIDSTTISMLEFTWRSLFWLLVAWLFMVGRDFGYILRIRYLTGKSINWRQAFRIIMLWEFTSAISPSTVGGTALAVVFLHKEGLSVGRSTAVVLATSFLDELYFVLMFPVILAVVGGKVLFSSSTMAAGAQLMNNLIIVAVIGYTIILLWVLLVGYGLFFNPASIKKVLTGLFKLPGLRRWKDNAEKAGDDIVASSEELKDKPISFWLKAFLATFLSWTSRYWVVNAILLAFFAVKEHFLIFARQLVTWIMMIISPTPGGSGFAEIILGRFISDTIPGDPLYTGSLALAIAIIWRLISYYPYLLIGASIVPRWIQKKFVHQHS